MKSKAGNAFRLHPVNPLWEQQGVIRGWLRLPEGEALGLWHADGTFSKEFPEHNLVEFTALDYKTHTWDQFCEVNK